MTRFNEIKMRKKYLYYFNSFLLSFILHFYCCCCFVLEERCNCIAKFCFCHRMSPVCRSSVMRVYCDKTTANRIIRPHCKTVRVSSVGVVSSKTTFDGGPLDREAQPMLGGLGLCQTVVTAGYIFTYDVTLLPLSQRQ